MIAAEFGTGQVFLSMMWFFLFVVWFWMLIAIFGDIFRSRDLSGWGKAGWSLLVIVLPFIGILSYLIVRGHKMSDRALEDAQLEDQRFRARVQSAVTETDPAEELNALASLHDRGVIDDDEFRRMKAKVVA